MATVGIMNDEQLNLDDLEEVSGGATVRLPFKKGDKGINMTWTCLRCGSGDLEGIKDGAIFHDRYDFYRTIEHKRIRCRTCGYRDFGMRMKCKERVG